MNNLKKFNDVLKGLREERRISQRELAEKLNISNSAIGMYESGKRQPNYEALENIADFFNVDMNYLLGKTPIRNIYRDGNLNDFVSRGVKIPVLGKVVAGIPIEAIEEILNYEEIDESLARTGEFFALQVKGDSMEPRMLEGDVVIVRKQESVNSGDIAIVLVNGDEATVKRVRILENGLMLIPFNSKYVPWTYTAKEVENMPVQIIGKVVELRGKF